MRREVLFSNESTNQGAGTTNIIMSIAAREETKILTSRQYREGWVLKTFYGLKVVKRSGSTSVKDAEKCRRQEAL